jgi:hypothetical protein
MAPPVTLDADEPHLLNDTIAYHHEHLKQSRTPGLPGRAGTRARRIN